MTEISVLVADDHTVVREGLRALLSAEADIQVIGEAQDGQEAVDLARRTRPEVVLMDLAMPVLNGLEATRQIRRELPATKVVVLTSYDNAEYVRQMMAAGVRGYLLKQTAAQDLLKAIRTVQSGNRFFSPSIARQLRHEFRKTPSNQTATGGKSKLTPRERQVLELVAQGFSSKEMASELGISPKTVEKHRQGVMKKLRIHEVAGLTRYALSAGLLEPGNRDVGDLRPELAEGRH